MLIDPRKCVACGNCVPVCPMGAIYLEAGLAQVNQDECVECSTCYRFLPSEGLPPALVRFARRAIALLRLRFDQPLDRCPTGALEPPDLEWPRSLRRAFSDPLVVHDDTGLAGRGTEEIKTNDITGRIGEGEAGMVIDLGRPGIGVNFSDIQKVTMALAALGTEFEPDNPVTLLMEDRATGQLKPEILDEKVLSAIIEFKTTLDRLPRYLQCHRRSRRRARHRHQRRCLESLWAGWRDPASGGLPGGGSGLVCRTERQTWGWVVRSRL